LESNGQILYVTFSAMVEEFSAYYDVSPTLATMYDVPKFVPN